jgi:hypothetical protein
MPFGGWIYSARHAERRGQATKNIPNKTLNMTGALRSEWYPLINKEVNERTFFWWDSKSFFQISGVVVGWWRRKTLKVI